MAWKISAVIKKSYFNNFDTVESKLSFLWIMWSFCAITPHDKVAQYCVVGYWKKKKNKIEISTHLIHALLWLFDV